MVGNPQLAPPVKVVCTLVGFAVYSQAKKSHDKKNHLMYKKHISSQ